MKKERLERFFGKFETVEQLNPSVFNLKGAGILIKQFGRRGR